MRHVALNIRTIDSDLRKAFKILCLEKDVDMQDAVIALIKQAVDAQTLPSNIPRRTQNADHSNT